MVKRVANLHFKTHLLQKIPNRTDLINILMDILGVEKETVYRRLREEVPFSFEEAALISKELKISLDLLLGIETEKQRPFRLQLADFEYPNEIEYEIWENFNSHLSELAETNSFTTAEAWTSIPFPFCYNYYYLTKFYIFKWAFQVHNHNPIKRFDEIQVDERLYKIAKEYYTIYKKASVSEYIVSNAIFKDVIKDVKLFYDLNRISKEELNLIIKDMEGCIDFLEQIVMRGGYKTNEKEIRVYVSNLSIDTNYALIQGGNQYITLLRTFILNSAVNTDKVTFDYMKQCFTSLKRLSTYISMSGEKERIKYFNNERKHIQSLKI
ncbi:MAG: hypothetical protein LUG18_04155 [Candidatus Azobacteroides sp.]|nr:hypothetical protein [Candidatus Azobacteroides sp.]